MKNITEVLVIAFFILAFLIIFFLPFTNYLAMDKTKTVQEVIPVWEIDSWKESRDICEENGGMAFVIRREELDGSRYYAMICERTEATNQGVSISGYIK